MALNRKTGLILGFGVGLVIAAVIFSVSWLVSNREKAALTKTRALPQGQPATQPQQPTVAPNGEGGPQDTLLERLTPSEEEVVQDIQESMNELFGATPGQQ